MYAVMGTFLFQKNDPIRFGNLHSSMMTLFEVLTLEGWNDVFNTQMLGSDVTYSEEWRQLTVGRRVSTPHPIEAAAYFVTFIMLGTMIMLNLFTGVIINSMQEAQAVHDTTTAVAAADDDDKPDRTSDSLNPAAINQQVALIASQLREVSADIAALKEQTFQLRHDSGGAGRTLADSDGETAKRDKNA
jgi:voltage-gated sodium channel